MRKFWKLFDIIWTAGIFLLAMTMMAQAGPVAAIGAVVGKWMATTVIGKFVAQAAISLGMSALASVIAKKKQSKIDNNGGISTETTLQGGVQSQRILIGEYATAGQEVCPPYTYNFTQFVVSINQDLQYMTRIIAISDMPINSVQSVIIDGKPYTIQTSNPHAQFGNRLSGVLDGKAWIKVYNGTQTTADAQFVNLLSNYPERPWTADHKLIGTAYAFITTKWDSNVFQGIPAVKFVVRGMPLYDPRRDSTVGGNGTQRFDQPSTWVWSTNPIVQAYNIMRGIRLPDGNIYGVGASSSELPTSNWFAAMNICDQNPNGTNDTRRYQAGFEWSLEDEPLDVIEELLAAAGGKIADMGGFYSVSVGPVGVHVASITDEHIIISQPIDASQLRGLNATYNGVSANHPSPDDLWVSVDAVPLHNADWEAADDGRRLVADLKLSAVPYPAQVRRLMREMAKDNRRELQWNITLGPWAISLDVLDVLSWTSAQNGYSAKKFEVTSKSVDPETLCVTLGLRERDNADYVYDNVFDQQRPTTPNPSIIKPTIIGLQGFQAAGYAIRNAENMVMDVGIRASWQIATNYQSVTIQVLNSTNEVVSEGTTTDVESGSLSITGGLLGSTTYQVRALARIDGRQSEWSVAVSVATPATAPVVDLLGAETREALDTLNEWIDSDLPAQIDIISNELDGLPDQLNDIRDRITGTETGLTTLESNVISLQGNVVSLNSGLAAQANATSALTIRVANTESRISTQATQLTNLTANLNSVRTTANNALVAANTNATAISGLTVRVANAEGQLISQTSRMDNLTANLSSVEADIDANAGAISALDVQVSQIGNTVNAHSSSLTSLQSNLTSLANTQAGQATALNNLTVRVANTEGQLSSVGTSITQLQANIVSVANTANTALGRANSALTQANSAANAVQALDVRVTQQGNTLSSLSSSYTALSSTVSGQANIIAGHSAAITSLDTGTNWLAGQVNSHATSITNLTTQVGAATGSGQFRIDVQGSSSGIVSTIGLKAVAGAGEASSAREAALFLQATSNGQSRVVVRANNFAVSTGQSQHVPFIIENDTVYISKASIKNADIDTLKLAGQAVTIPVTQTWDNVVGDNGFVGDLDITVPDNTPILMLLTGRLNWGGSQSAYWGRLKIRLNNEDITPWTRVSDAGEALVLSGSVTVSGWNRFRIYWERAGDATLGQRTLTLIGVKR